MPSLPAPPAPPSSVPAAPAPRSLDSLGCPLGGLDADHELLCGAGITFHRKRSRSGGPGPVFTPASDRGYLVGISMQPGHRRRIVHGRAGTVHHFDPGSVYVRDFAEDYRAELEGPLDFLLMEISRPAFERAAEDRPARTGRRVQGLECVTGLPDPVLAHLAQALVFAIERPQEAAPLFIDQMGLLIGMHLTTQYGGDLARDALHGRTAGRRLSRQHEARAKEMLRSRLDGGVSITEVADACALSRSYFIRAFRETTGQTPLQWLQAQRLARARTLLADAGQPLADIAIACGFADQSHFTRVFTRAEGKPPGTWRRDGGLVGRVGLEPTTKGL